MALGSLSRCEEVFSAPFQRDFWLHFGGRRVSEQGKSSGLWLCGPMQVTAVGQGCSFGKGVRSQSKQIRQKRLESFQLIPPFGEMFSLSSTIFNPWDTSSECLAGYTLTELLKDLQNWASFPILGKTAGSPGTPWCLSYGRFEKWRSLS
jgi:hypothetical protein